MVIVEVPHVQSLIGCHTSNTTCSSHLLAIHRITEACVLRRSFAALWAAHGLLHEYIMLCHKKMKYVHVEETKKISNSLSIKTST